MAKRRDYGFLRSYASIGRDPTQFRNLQNAGYGGVLIDYSDPYLAQAVHDAQQMGLSYGFWGDPNRVENDPTRFAMRMAQLRAQYGGDLFVPDIEFIGKGDPGSEGWNRNARFAQEWQKYMGGARTAVAPMGYQSDFNYAAWGPNTEWLPQAYYADSVGGAPGDAQRAVNELIAAARAQGLNIDASMVSPILAPAHFRAGGPGGYGGSGLFTIDDFLPYGALPFPKASGPATQSQAPGGSGAPTRSTTNRYYGPPTLAPLGRGASQSTEQVREQGLHWGGKVFENKNQFAQWLNKRGRSYASWAQKHQPAAAGLKGRK